MISLKETAALLETTGLKDLPDGEYIIQEKGINLIVWIPQLNETRLIKRLLNTVPRFTKPLPMQERHQGKPQTVQAGCGGCGDSKPLRPTTKVR
jgi:hypothetical protein